MEDGHRAHVASRVSAITSSGRGVKLFSEQSARREKTVDSVTYNIRKYRVGIVSKMVMILIIVQVSRAKDRRNKS